MSRPIREIAREIRALWRPMYFGAVPYSEAMLTMAKASDKYGLDDGESIINYFLANATTWRGADARRIKAELKQALSDARIDEQFDLPGRPWNTPNAKTKRDKLANAALDRILAKVPASGIKIAATAPDETVEQIYDRLHRVP